jgi:large subunit ribosomal protein L4
MISVNVYNQQGTEVGKVEIDPAEFGGKVNRQLLHEVVLMYLANQRAGTHSTLRRGEVAGSTKKLFRQKGTGNARVGTRRTNKRRGGGTAKGPKPRDYEYHLPKKAVRAATRMAILSKFEDREVVVVEDLKVAEVKTKPVAALLNTMLQTAVKAEQPDADQQKEALKKDKKTWLVGIADYDDTLYRSMRNIPGVKLQPVAQFNAYTVLRQKRLLLTKAALEELRKGPPMKQHEPEAPAQPAEVK